ncbi:ESX-1 secretion-associated protein, partial [Mycobacterium sp. CBMA361]|nr:ESX-1 secretion-associated protein [Mycolicibacterium sp. CBMA 361]
MSGFSNDLAAKLDTAATQYTGTDAQQGSKLDGEMHR